MASKYKDTFNIALFPLVILQGMTSAPTLNGIRPLKTMSRSSPESCRYQRLCALLDPEQYPYLDTLAYISNRPGALATNPSLVPQGTAFQSPLSLVGKAVSRLATTAQFLFLRRYPLCLLETFPILLSLTRRCPRCCTEPRGAFLRRATTTLQRRSLQPEHSACNHPRKAEMCLGPRRHRHAHTRTYARVCLSSPQRQSPRGQDRDRNGPHALAESGREDILSEDACVVQQQQQQQHHMP